MVPVAAYQSERRVRHDQGGRGPNGWLDEAAVVMETVTAIKRAGADMILTYFAIDVARRIGG